MATQNTWKIFESRGEVVTGKLTATEQARLRQVARTCRVTSSAKLASDDAASYWALLRAIAAGQVQVQAPPVPDGDAAAPAGGNPESCQRGCPVG